MVDAEDFGLSDKQAAFIRLHFSGAYSSQGEAYVAAGYSKKASESAASRLLKNVNSQKYLRHLRTEAHSALINRLSGYATTAAQVLDEVASNPANPPQTRVSAAKATLDSYQSTYKAGIQDEQIQALENQIKLLTGDI